MIKELSSRDLKKSQALRKQMRQNDNKIRRLLSEQDSLRTKLVRLMFQLDFKSQEKEA